MNRQENVTSGYAHLKKGAEYWSTTGPSSGLETPTLSLLITLKCTVKDDDLFIETQRMIRSELMA
jgi:hypothetical protein